MDATKGFHCSACGRWHDELPFDYGADLPDLVSTVPKAEHNNRVFSNSEICVVDEQHYFVRAIIELPVHDVDKVFCWGVWVSLSKESFERMLAKWETEGRESEPPCFGWLSTALPYSERTIHLKTMVHTQPLGDRPRVELEPTMHQLAVEQRKGISLRRVEEIAAMLLHAGQ